MIGPIESDFPQLATEPLATQRVEKNIGVHRKLMEARLALQGKKLNKSGHNKFAGYQYFELGDFLPTVQQIFSEIGLCGIVSYTADIASLSIFDVDGGGSVTITSPMGSAALKGCHEVQNVGAVETYQRRYLWVTAMEIVEHDALDATTGKEKPAPQAAAKSEARSEWDKLDEATKQWMTNEAMAVTVLTAGGDIEGAYHHLESLQLEDDYKVAFWSRLDATQRSALKACGQLIRANNSAQLMTAWGSVPKHSQPALTGLKERRKAELQPMEAAA